MEASLVLVSMPERYIHTKLSEFLLGDKCEDTHAAIDRPAKKLGSGHRKLYHDPFTASVIGLLEDGYKGTISGIAHIITDNCVDNDLYKEALRFSLKVLEYVNDDIERAENGVRSRIKN